MATASDNVFPKLILAEGSAPAAPSSGQVKLYAKADGLLYSKDDAGTESAVSGTAGGGMTHSYIGYNTVGGTVEDAVANRNLCKSVTLASAGFIASIGAYIQMDTGPDSFGFMVGVWDDATATVGKLLAYGAPYGAGSGGSPGAAAVIAATSPRWVHVPLGFYATAGTYWIGIMTHACGFGANRLNLYYDGSGSDRRFDSGAGYLYDGGGTGGQTDTTRKYSIRASVLT